MITNAASLPVFIQVLIVLFLINNVKELQGMI